MRRILQIMSNFFWQKVLITGGTILWLVSLYVTSLRMGALVKVTGLDEPDRAPSGTEHIKVDLRDFQSCLGCYYAWNSLSLAGVKGSPQMTRERPSSFMVPTIQFSINSLKPLGGNVKRYLFTSSVEYMSQQKYLRKLLYGKHFSKMISLQGGPSEYVNYKLKHIRLNIIGMPFLLSGLLCLQWWQFRWK